jgi:hypothetical protein
MFFGQAFSSDFQILPKTVHHTNNNELSKYNKIKSFAPRPIHDQITIYVASFLINAMLHACQILNVKTPELPIVTS